MKKCLPADRRSVTAPKAAYNYMSNASTVPETPSNYLVRPPSQTASASTSAGCETPQQLPLHKRPMNCVDVPSDCVYGLSSKRAYVLFGVARQQLGDLVHAVHAAHATHASGGACGRLLLGGVHNDGLRGGEQGRHAGRIQQRCSHHLHKVCAWSGLMGMFQGSFFTPCQDNRPGLLHARRPLPCV